ncbi:MAG: multifunctional CCA addition/repair protein [Pseudomonadota bacterium]
MEIYLVGGAVRDQLLGQVPRERDWVVVGATPDDLLAKGFTQVGKDFPVFLHPKTQEEYALARIERKTGRGYGGFAVQADATVTLEQDLLRRDLTINAIAQTADGTLIDPYNGQEDINNRVLRHVSDAFVEDPLRVLRLARFAARFHQLGFSIAEETLLLLKAIVASGELDALVKERVWAETDKALSTNNPEVFFETLRECNALAVIFPEVERLWGVPQPERWHPEIDTGVHTMMVVAAAAKLSPDKEVRFAALTHDLGKADTPKDILPNHRGHEERSVTRLNELCDRIGVPKSFRELGVLVARYHGLVHRAFELKATTILRLLNQTDAFRRPRRFAQFLLACEADSRGRLGLEKRPYPQADWLMRALKVAANISGKDFADQNLSGVQIADAIRQRRIGTIKNIMTHKN